MEAKGKEAYCFGIVKQLESTQRLRLFVRGAEEDEVEVVAPFRKGGGAASHSKGHQRHSKYTTPTPFNETYRLEV
jgi:hypothetical protein